jgi:hypothetical protein
VRGFHGPRKDPGLEAITVLERNSRSAIPMKSFTIPYAKICAVLRRGFYIHLNIRRLAGRYLATRLHHPVTQAEYTRYHLSYRDSSFVMAGATFPPL